MGVSVLNRRDVLEEGAGTILVPARTRGTVAAKTLPPNPLTFQVSFPVGATPPTLVWLRLEDLLFIDGPIGVVKEILEGTAFTVTKAEYVDPVAEIDPQIGDAPVVYPGRMKVTFSNGMILAIESQRNTGMLGFTFS